MLNKAKVGDCVRVDNTIFTKQPGNVWTSVFDSYMESVFARKIAGKKVDYLFLEEKVEKKPVFEAKESVKMDKKHQKSREENKFSLEIEPKEIKNVQEREEQAE